MTMAAAQSFDLVILGSGSTAFAAALRAQELGKTVVMTEERTLGGTCVNRGCLPSKNLIEAAKLLHDARHPRYPGLRAAAMEFDFTALVEQKDDLVHDYRERKYQSLVGGKIRIEKGHAQFVDSHTVEVDGRRLRGDRVLIATGSRPAMPEIDGLDRTPHLTSDLLTSDEKQELRELPRSLLIVGGGYIALELGQMFARFGTKVTVVERSGELLAHGYEPEVGPAVREVLEREGVRVLTGSEVRAVRGSESGIVATVEADGRRLELEATDLLVATGRRPNTDLIEIEKAGVTLDGRAQVKVDEFLRTNVAHIYAAGDVIGSETHAQMATPVGSQDGGIAAHNAFADEPPRAVDHRVIPRAIFIDPQLAVVGLTEERAVAQGHRCWCRATAMELVPRAGAIRDTSGFIKMVADRDTGDVLGVTMLGANAAEVIHEAAMALRFRANLRDFIELLHVYPTMAEAMKIAAISRLKDPARLSCCAE